jgi:uncharacterized SAM-binding protein YcdF (DUF218 family)
MLHAPILGWLGGVLVENDRPEKADCILVLGGDEFGERIVKAGQLIQAGYAPYAWVDGPATLVAHESDYTIQYASRRGYPPSLFRPLWLPPGVNSTITEVQYVANNFLRPAGVKKILLVTSNFHTHRAAHFIRKEVPWLKVVVVAAPDDVFSPGSWWKTRKGIQTFVMESIKSLTEWWGV